MAVAEARKAMEAPVLTIGAMAFAFCIVVIVGGISAAAVHNGCFHPPPPVTRPDPGTPRANYCNAVIRTRPWISLTLGPLLVVAVTGVVTRRRTAIVAVSLLICCIVIACAIIANTLTASLTVAG
jgi:hypothetical protein